MAPGGDHGVDPTQATVTRLLAELEEGDRGALDELFSRVYGELHALARRQRRRWHGNHTLNTTALVHEAYVKLVGREQISVESRAHFLALAARAMRQILCNYARDQRARKRGGGIERVTLDDLPEAGRWAASPEDPSDALLALDEALRRLETVDPRQSTVVECRFFGGLTVEETAAAMRVSPRTVKRAWAVAQAWLHREMERRS
jgi:RNA polymerase sigma factor (TIGR02999 family)